MAATKRKKVHLDILRVMAIFGVIFLHSGGRGIYHYQNTDNAVNFWFGFACAAIVQCCVPLFFMISGALLLNREESLGYVYKHRVLRMFLVLLILTLIQFLSNYFHNPEFGFDITRFFQILYEGTLQGQYWYVYEYLAFLMVLPFLQRMVKAITEKSWYIYMIAIYLILNSLCPILTYYLEWLNVKFYLYIFGGCIFYSVMGYFVEHASEDIFYKGRNILIMTVAGGAMLAETLHLNYLNLAEHPSGAYSHLFAPFFALYLFVLVRFICFRFQIPQALRKVFAFAGSGVFGTYLLDATLRQLLLPVYEFLHDKIHSYPAAFVWILCCMVVGIVFSNLIKKIPYVGKLL